MIFFGGVGRRHGCGKEEEINPSFLLIVPPPHKRQILYLVLACDPKSLVLIASRSPLPKHWNAICHRLEKRQFLCLEKSGRYRYGEEFQSHHPMLSDGKFFFFERGGENVECLPIERGGREGGPLVSQETQVWETWQRNKKGVSVRILWRER